MTPSLVTADLESDQVYDQSLSDLVRQGIAPVTRTYTHAGRLESVEYPSGRIISYNQYENGTLKDIREGAQTIAHYSYRGGRVAGRTLGGVLRTDVAYAPETHGAHISSVTHTKVSGGPALDTWTFDWDANYNKLLRERDGALAKVHEYQYDARNRMIQSLVNTVPSVSYPLDKSGNRSAAPYTTVDTLHEYVTSPLGPMDYDPNGNLVELPDEFERYQYNAENALLDRWGFGDVLQQDFAGSITGDYAILAGDFTAAAGYLAPEGGGIILNETVPADVNQVTFSYLSKLDPEDPDGDPGTVDYGPDYYALFLMKVGQENQPQPDDEWSYLSLAIEPGGLVLRKWQDDEVVVVQEYVVTSTRDTWYDVQIDFSGTGNEHVTVKHGLHGGTMATAINASTGLASDHVNVGFAVGKLAKDGYLFDNLRIRGNSISAESMEWRGHGQ